MDQSQLIISIKRFLAVLSPLLSEWGEQFQLFKQGLVRCQPEVIEQSLISLQEYQQKFNNLIKIRDQIIRHAGQSGLITKTLKELSRQFSSDVASELILSLEETETQLRSLHQQLWSMWVISNRSQHSLSQMLEMFTQDSGQRDLYSNKKVHVNHGGLLLDTAI
jgi:hypothetical protein